MEMNENIIVKPDPRKGWTEAALEMHESGYDLSLPEEPDYGFDEEEWAC